MAERVAIELVRPAKPSTDELLDLIEALERRIVVLEQRQVQFPNLSRVFNA